MPSYSYADVLRTSLETQEKKIPLDVVIIDGDSGLFLTQVCRILEFSPFEIRHGIKSLGIDSKTIEGETLDFFKCEGIVHLKARRATFISFEGIHDIVAAIGNEKQKLIFDPHGNQAKTETIDIPKASESGRSNWSRLNDRMLDLEMEVTVLKTMVESLMRRDMIDTISASLKASASHKAHSIHGPGEKCSLQGHMEGYLPL